MCTRFIKLCIKSRKLSKRKGNKRKCSITFYIFKWVPDSSNYALNPGNYPKGKETEENVVQYYILHF
jgi:hypothetical protein